MKNGGGFNSNFWSPKEAKTTIRIIPPNPEIQGMLPGVFFVKHNEHNINGQRIGCAAEILQEDCPICTKRIEIYRERKGNPASCTPEREQFLAATHSSRRFLALVIVKGEEDKGVQIWSFGKKMLDKLLSFYVDFCADGDDELSDMDNGRDIIINKTIIHTENGNFPNYDNSIPSPKLTAAGTPEMIAKWWTEQPKLLEIASANIKSYSEVAQIAEQLMESFERKAPQAPQTPQALQSYAAPTASTPGTPQSTVGGPPELSIAGVLGEIDLSSPEALIAFQGWQKNGNNDLQLLLEVANSYPKPGTTAAAAPQKPAEKVQTEIYDDPEALLAKIQNELDE